MGFCNWLTSKTSFTVSENDDLSWFTYVGLEDVCEKDLLESASLEGEVVIQSGTRKRKRPRKSTIWRKISEYKFASLLGGLTSIWRTTLDEDWEQMIMIPGQREGIYLSLFSSWFSSRLLLWRIQKFFCWSTTPKCIWMGMYPMILRESESHISSQSFSILHQGLVILLCPFKEMEI